MAKILLKTECNGNNSTNFYYDTAEREKQNSPLVQETKAVFVCTPFFIQQGTPLDSYCAMGDDGKPVRRDVVAGDVRTIIYYTHSDHEDGACNGSCDLAVTYSEAFPTSTPKAMNGKLILEARSSHPPIDCYVGGLPDPVLNDGLVRVGIWQFTFENVPPGTYGAQFRDNGNCQKAVNGLTVTKGNAPGTGGFGGPGFPVINWLKYEHEFSTTNNGGDDGTIRGWAWNKTTRQYEEVKPIKLRYPAYTSRRDYAQGDIVSYIRDGEDQRFYYRATRPLLQNDFPDDDRKVPNPEADHEDVWQMVNKQYNNGLSFLYKGDLIRKLYDPFYQRKQSYGGGDGKDYHYFYPKDTVVRYDYTGFYRAKKDLEANDFTDRIIPPPTVGGSNEQWEKVEGYDGFYYAASETDIIDQYALGTLSRTVRFHTFSPNDLAQVYGAPLYLPNRAAYVPTASSWVKMPEGDYILFDDNTPTVETQLGDLKVIDITKVDIDRNGAENGRVAILTETPSPPVRYHLRNGVRPGYQQDNTTGIYENLHPGLYTVDIYDAKDRYVAADFTIEDRYYARWRLNFDNQRGTSKQITIYERDWKGGVTDVVGTDEPVVRGWDTGDATGKSLPSVVGSFLDFKLYNSVAQQFVDTATRDDRSHRVDFSSNGQPEFSGYLSATLYEESLVGVGHPVTLTASCGLAQLNDTKWVNHLRERQEARTSMLSVVLKILSYCDLNLPVWCGLNLRDQLMAADSDPLEQAYIHRNAFNKKDGKVIADEDIIDCRTVLEAILKPFNAHLTQAAGCWKIVSYSEVHTDYAVRVWSPVGVLQTDVDTKPVPVHILPPTEATGFNEVYWINSSQRRTTVSPAQMVKATVDRQLEDTLLRNGDFVDWDGSNTRPLYWSVEGNASLTRDKGEKSGEYAVRFANYGTSIAPNTGLLSPSAPHLPAPDEDVMLLKFKTILEPTTTNPAELKATLYFQVVCDGVNYGAPIAADVSTKDKWKEQTIYLPTGLPGTSVRIRMLPPVAVDSDAAQTTLRANNLSLAIQPGRVEWPKNQYAEVKNPLKYPTGVVLDPVELILADLPLLPGAKGFPLPPFKMDVHAWRHAISLLNFDATTRWARPGYKNSRTLLENAAQDRMVMYQAPATILKGTLKGPGIDLLRAGQMLDAPADVEGKYFILTCVLNERKGTAEITARKLADGYFDGAVPDVPTNVRIANKDDVKGYRIAFVNGVKGFRVVNK